MASGNKKKAAQSAAQLPASMPSQTPMPTPAPQVNSDQRGPGRPPGSPNIDYERCVTVPVKCRKCGSTEFGRRQHVVSRMISGTVDGHQYNCVSHYKTRCASEKCQQATVIIEYRMVPLNEEAGFDEPKDVDFDAAANDAPKTNGAHDAPDADSDDDFDDALDLDEILAAEEAGT